MNNCDRREIFMDYKNTLRMPVTDFPMKGNLPAREPEIQARWQELDIYKLVQERTNGRPTYILHDGPPYANGDLHMGHALNKVLKDMTVRSRSMMGYHAPYVPGWDTHGLPIETALAKSGKVDRKKMSVADFRKLCEEYALGQIDNQRKQFKSLAIRGDWENPYITLKPEFEAEQIKVFGEMAKKGYIYKGLKPVNWSPSSESALAEAEIEYQDKRSPSIYVAFAVTDGKGMLEEGTKIIIWTTTPWTIPANLGIAVNSDFEYVVAKVGNDQFVVANDLFESVSTSLEWEAPQIMKKLKGSDLEYVETQHPFYDRKSPVALSDHVSMDAGTGCVHTSPGHGEDDFLVGQKYHWGIICPVDEKGFMTEEAPGFAGLFYDDANKKITEKLEEVGALLKFELITHSYPHDWRTKKPTIYRATAQWFASIKDFRGDLLQAIRDTKFVPSWGETRLYNMVRDRGDWCISRQRAWGVPIPVFYAEDGSPIINDETINHVSSLFKEFGSNVWFEREAIDLLPAGFKHPNSPNGSFTKETDIMDVWFDSGSSHQAVLTTRPELRRPADLYLEGSDQYRGWFNSSLSTAVAVTGIAPYKGVLSHGFVLDKEGRKMSKSLGNITLPETIAKQYGVDILRLWVSSVDYQSDVRISDDVLKQIAEVYRKIRNTFRFLLGNLADFDANKNAVAFDQMESIHQYVLVKLNQVVKTSLDAYNNFSFSDIFHAVNNFCANDLSAFYLDYAKDILYCDAENSDSRRAIQTVLHQCLMKLVKLLVPILPHTTDEAWKYMKDADQVSVQLCDFPAVEEIVNENEITAKWDAFLNLRDDVLKALEEARVEKIIGKSLNAQVNCYVNEEIALLLTSFSEKLEQLFIASKVEFASFSAAPKEAMQFSGHAVLIQKAVGETCERCWNISEEVGTIGDAPTLCKRCAEVVTI